MGWGIVPDGKRYDNNTVLVGISLREVESYRLDIAGMFEEPTKIFNFLGFTVVECRYRAMGYHFRAFLNCGHNWPQRLKTALRL